MPVRIPRNILSEKMSLNTGFCNFVFGWRLITCQFGFGKTFHPDKIFSPETEKSAEFRDPTPGHLFCFRRTGRTAILVLWRLPVKNKRNTKKDRHSERHAENRRMFGP